MQKSNEQCIINVILQYLFPRNYVVSASYFEYKRESERHTVVRSYQLSCHLLQTFSTSFDHLIIILFQNFIISQITGIPKTNPGNKLIVFYQINFPINHYLNKAIHDWKNTLIRYLLLFYLSEKFSNFRAIFRFHDEKEMKKWQL